MSVRETQLFSFEYPEPLTNASCFLVHYAVSKTLYPNVFCHESKETSTLWFEIMVDNPCGTRSMLYFSRAFIPILTTYKFSTAALP